MLAIDGVPFGILQAWVYVFPGRNQVDVYFLNSFASDESKAGVTRRSHQVETALVHQSHHFIRSGRGFNIHFTPGLGFKFGHPVECWIGFSAFDITGPGDNIDLSFTFTNRLKWLGIGVGIKKQGGYSCCF